jgi:hypothetical protein
LVFEQYGLGNHSPQTAGPGKSKNRGGETDEEHNQIAHG